MGRVQVGSGPRGGDESRDFSHEAREKKKKSASLKQGRQSM